jgi:hypothetical protein
VRCSSARKGLIAQAPAAAEDLRVQSDSPQSEPIASLPDEKEKGCDHPDQDQHPVLAFETEKRKMLNEKLHCSRSPFLRAE